MPLHSTYKPFDMSFTQDSSAKKISLSHNSEVAPNDTLEMNLDCGKNSIKDSQIIEDNSSTLHELSSTKKQPESTYDRQETQHTQQVLQDNLKTQDVPMEETTEEITLEIPAFPAHLLGNYATLFGISDNSTHRNTIKSDNNQTIHDKKEYIKSHIYSDTESFLAVPTQDHIEKKIEITEITQSNLATQGTTSPTIVDNTHVNGIERSQAIQSNSNNSFVEANNLTPTKSFIARGLQDTMETNHHQPFPQDTMINDLKEKDSYIHLQETSQPSTQTNLHINLQMNPSTNTMQEYESTQDVKISEPKSLQPKAEVYNHDLKQYEQNNRLESPLQNNKVESVPYNLDSTHSNQTKANYHDMIRTQEKGYNVQQIQIKEQPDFIESTYSQNVLSQGKALSDTTSVQQRSKDSEIMQTQSSSMQNLQQDSHISYDEIPTSRLKTQNATTHQYPSEIQQDSNLQNIIPYTLPPASLLSVPKFHENIDDQEIDSKIENLLAKLRVFKIKGDIVSVFTGPVVTTFEFRPEADVKVNKVLGLQDDLAMALKAKSIRIQAPIPGKDVMGIEIPNNNVATIYLREILESQAFLQANDSLSIVLGKDIMGQPVVQNLAKLPHLLVAGTTGSGKSVGVNAIILSLLYRNSPDELKLMMIDPKKVEFAPYEDLPHLITPIINAPDKAIQALQAAAIEMDKRYEILSEHKVKTILSYNEKVEQKMPFFVIIIDELADLMMTGGKDAEAPIARIAQMGRAAGVHLIIATQRSSTNVVTGTIKANLPSRISYRVGNRVDSKVILDASGAERLLGNGDGLFSSPNGLQRIHAPWVSEREIEEIIDFIKSQREPQYDENFLSDNKSGVDLGDKFVGDGGILDEAKAVMLRDNKTSISNLQRKLGIGYNKAANIVEQLELEGFLSAPNNKGERTIMG
ncbi:hypothetical protein CQA53_02375 [Helicobacter didelphidarum]|uniref:FtsK domain-containing protein n=1 Tax=Helicobacter didelphidarum TaxID=2040648 RepID=A0A3D8IQB5_9HELI|nr:hypothetical protein CQA53_02375 [Helicobacter didelphidarum]